MRCNSRFAQCVSESFQNIRGGINKRTVKIENDRPCFIMAGQQLIALLTKYNKAGTPVFGDLVKMRFAIESQVVAVSLKVISHLFLFSL